MKSAEGLKWMDDLTYKAEYCVSDDVLKDILNIIASIPQKYMRKQNNCNCTELIYTNEAVNQMRPSTHPVFLIKKYNVVVKIIDDSKRAESERYARKVLGGYFSIVPAMFYKKNTYTMIIMPYIENSFMLSEMIDIDAEEFFCQYNHLLKKIVKYVQLNKSSDNLLLNRVRYAGRSVECMIKWCDELLQISQGIKIYSEVSHTKYDLLSILLSVRSELKKKPRSCCLFSGDVNLHNVLYTQKSGLFLVDFEYWGVFEVEYIYSVIIGSLISHCDLFRNCSCMDRNEELSIRYDVRPEIKMCFLNYRFFERLALSGINLQRIRNFILARWYYRILNVIRADNESNICRLVYLLDVFQEQK